MVQSNVARGATACLIAFSVAVAAVGSALINQAAPALAAPTATTSRYEQTLDTATLRNQGCAAAGTTGVTIINFAQPWYQNGTYGTNNWTGQFFSIAQITNAAEDWLSGYYTCNGTNMLLAVGTSNNFGWTGSGHGSAWASMINTINAWIASPPSWLGVEQAKGAIDAETGWSNPTDTRAWADGYDSSYNCANSCSIYYDEGDAGGCPPAGSCNGVWTQHDVWYMAWGATAAYPFSEIYFNPPPGTPINAQQWQAINSLYSIGFVGVLTEHAANGNSNIPSDGWQELANVSGQSPSFLSDITWAN